jgi:hypothetical protein
MDIIYGEKLKLKKSCNCSHNVEVYNVKFEFFEYIKFCLILDSWS